MNTAHPHDLAQAFLDALEDAAVMLNDQGVIFAANAPARAAGFEPHRTTADEPLIPVAALFDMARATAVPAAGNAEDPESLLRTPDGRTLLPRIAPLQDVTGRSLGYLLTLVDVTAQLPAQANKAKSLSAISHRFLTPMTSIQMSLHLLLEDTQEPPSERHLDLLKTAAEDADKLHHQLQSLLAAEREKG